MSTAIPVLVTAYNRPERLRSCLSALAAAGVSHVLISLDGPAPGDGDRVRRTRAIAESGLEAFDRADIRISAEHRGCAGGVMGAVDWGFEHSASLIVVEDDIEVSPQFITFAGLLLERLGEDKRFGSIGGMSLVPSAHLARADVAARASVLPTSWGWATWSDRWETFRSGSFPEVRIPEAITGWSSRRYWRGIMRDVDSGRLDSWAYPWLRAHWQHGWWAVLPSASLVINRGFGTEATHTTGAMPSAFPQRVDVPSGFLGALEQQSDISLDPGADAWMRDNVLHADLPHLWYSRIRRRLRAR